MSTSRMNDQLNTLKAQEKIIKDLISKLEGQKQRLEVEETELMNILKSKEPKETQDSSTAATLNVELSPVKNELNLNPSLLSTMQAKRDQNEEEEEDDE